MSVVTDSVRSHRWQLTRLLHPWDSPGKNTGVGCHFLLQCMKVKCENEVAQSCLTLRDPHGLQPTRRLRPWDFPGKSTGEGCRMVIIQKPTDNKCWRGCGENTTLLHCWCEYKLVWPLWRTVWKFLKKLKIELIYDPATPLLGIYWAKTIIQKHTCIPVFTAAVFTMHGKSCWLPAL